MESIAASSSKRIITRALPLAHDPIEPVAGGPLPAARNGGYRSDARAMIEHETRSLVVRLSHVTPFAMREAMPLAAALTPKAQVAIEKYLAKGRRELREQAEAFIRWLRTSEAANLTAEELQRRFTFLRLKFNDVLSQFDMFSEVITQRSEHEVGILLSGIDVVAGDSLTLSEKFYEIPPVACYLARGPGAAIRRVKTKMPGDTENPVAIIRIPRERMIGTGISSSLVHEVGHQGASLLGLVESLRPVLQSHVKEQAQAGNPRPSWWYFDRWISEIVADLWGVSKVGVASTYGLIALVSLPSIFVFRLNEEGPHPCSYLRVKLSCAIGKELYPHPQWDELARLWEKLYPMNKINPKLREIILMIQGGIPEFIKLLCNHRPPSLKGRTIREVMPIAERMPAQLGRLFDEWQGSLIKMRTAKPTLAFAALGQARADGKITPERESQALAYLLKYWALRSTLDTAEACNL